MKRCITPLILSLSYLTLSYAAISGAEVFFRDSRGLTEYILKKTGGTQVIVTGYMHWTFDILRSQEGVINPIMGWDQHTMRVGLGGQSGAFDSFARGMQVLKIFLTLLEHSWFALKDCDGIGCATSRTNIGCIYGISRNLTIARLKEQCKERVLQGKSPSLACKYLEDSVGRPESPLD